LLIFSQAVAQITTSDRQASQAAWQLHRNWYYYESLAKWTISHFSEMPVGATLPWIL
jgi:hypothetical protein